MRICPKCNRQFPDNTLFCPDDGKALVDRTDTDNSARSGASSSHDPQFGAEPAGESTIEDFDTGIDELEDTVLDTTIEDVKAAKASYDQQQQQQQQQQQPQRQNTPSSPHQRSGSQAGASSNQAPKRHTPTRLDSPPALTQSSSDDNSQSSTQAPMDPSNLIGESLFGEYTISKKLGEGGMGAVYLARQDSIDQRIAVKVLHEDSAQSDELVQRFHREARVVSMLTHPNIIRVFIFGRTRGGLLYLAMEFVEGQELRSIIDEGILDEMRVIKIMKQLCSGLSEAHDLGIIHRDLKPDNVLLTQWRGEEDFAKILDFGIAKLKQPDTPEEQKNLTQAGIVYGTPEYLSPEQAQALELDHRTDIYSLGCILYELMTGQVPFQASTPVKILTAHVFNEVVPPSQIAPNRLSDTMEKIILKAMAKEPDDRFQNALDMFEALVAREQEIVTQQGLGNRAGYVPGMELTGMYNAADLADAIKADSPTQQPSTSSNSNQRTASGPDATSDIDSQMAQRAQQTQMSTGDDSSSTRLIIYLLIGGTAMLFMVLLITIGFLVFSG